MNFPLIANIVVFVVLLLLLAQARHKQWSLAKKVLVGLVMGVVFGLALHAIYGSDSPVLKDSIQWFNIVGNGYVQLLQMIVMPLVFASILSAVARLHNASQLGKTLIPFRNTPSSHLFLIPVKVLSSHFSQDSVMIFNVFFQ